MADEKKPPSSYKIHPGDEIPSGLDPADIARGFEVASDLTRAFVAVARSVLNVANVSPAMALSVTNTSLAHVLARMFVRCEAPPEIFETTIQGFADCVRYCVVKEREKKQKEDLEGAKTDGRSH